MKGPVSLSPFRDVIRGSVEKKNVLHDGNSTQDENACEYFNYEPKKKHMKKNHTLTV